jgi:hypothetical protein
MFMSDDNHTKQPSPRGTRLGLGLSGSDASLDTHALTPARVDQADQTRPAVAAGAHRRAGPARTVVGVPLGQSGSDKHFDDVESDTRYMEPPSETHSLPREQPEPEGLLSSTLDPYQSPARDELPRTGRDAGLFGATLNHSMAPESQRAQAAATLGASARAPEAWRDEVRRMVDRAPPKSPAPNAPGTKPSLRLKLESDPVEDSYRPPKSVLPKLLMLLAIVAALGGGAAVYMSSHPGPDGHSGISALIERFTGDAKPALAPAPNAVGQPETPGVQPPPSAAAPNPPTDTPAPTLQAKPGTPSADSPVSPQPATAAPQRALDLADPEPPTAAAPASQQAQAQPPAAAAAIQPSPKAALSAPKQKPKAAAAAAHSTARPPARHQEPVVKVRAIDAPNANAASSAEPPDPTGVPYVPVPYDPPAPDEPR